MPVLLEGHRDFFIRPATDTKSDHICLFNAGRNSYRMQPICIRTSSFSTVISISYTILQTALAITFVKPDVKVFIYLKMYIYI